MTAENRRLSHAGSTWQFLLNAKNATTSWRRVHFLKYSLKSEGFCEFAVFGNRDHSGKSPLTHSRKPAQCDNFLKRTTNTYV